MSGVSRRRGLLGVAKQSALGTPATAPTYLMPIIGGGLKANRTREDLPFTRDSASRPGQFITEASGGGDITVPVFPDPIGLLLYGLMGAQSYTAPVAPITAGQHTFIMSDDFAPLPFTFWSWVGDQWWRFDDSFILRGQLTGQSKQNARFAMTVLSFMAKKVNAPTLPTLTPNEPRFKFIGSTVELGADTATPVATTRVEQIDLIIDRRPDIKYGPSLTPALLTPERELGFQANVTYDPNDLGWAFVLGSAFGSASETALSQDVGTGSFFVDLGRHPTNPGGGDPRFMHIYSGPAQVPDTPPFTQNWEYETMRPDADPAGGPLEYQVTGQLVDAGAGASEVTVKIRNEVLNAY